MAETNTLARPYANAVFDLAHETGELSGWSDMLALLAGAVVHADMQKLLGNPWVSSKQLVELTAAVCGERLSRDGHNLVRLLVEQSRLELAPAIAAMYEQRRAEAERRVAVEVHSAVELTDERKRALSQALKARLKRSVELECKTDSELIGGVVIRAGDLVIDHSVREQLHQMMHTINR